MEIKNILWATDLSPESAQALETVTTLSQRFGAAVHLLYVVEDVHKYDHIYGDARPDMLTKLQTAEKEKAAEHMTKVCENQLNTCPAYFKHLLVGRPVAVIMDTIKNEKIDMVVMSTTGSGYLGGNQGPFGSVTYQVINQSPVPVVTVNP